jgi:membrane protein implicated in regulation of membrane protease activity
MSDLQHNSQGSVALDDSSDGLAMFVIFITAVLIVTGAVAMVAVVNTWWIVGMAFAIHVLMTTVVVATLVSVLNGRAGADVDLIPVERRRREIRPPTPIKPMTAR